MKLSVATQNLACQRSAEAVSIMCYGLYLRLLNAIQLCRLSKSDIYIVCPEWHYKKRARFCENLDKIDTTTHN